MALWFTRQGAVVTIRGRPRSIRAAPQTFSVTSLHRTHDGERLETSFDAQTIMLCCVSETELGAQCYSGYSQIRLLLAEELLTTRTAYNALMLLDHLSTPHRIEIPLPKSRCVSPPVAVWPGISAAASLAPGVYFTAPRQIRHLSKWHGWGMLGSSRPLLSCHFGNTCPKETTRPPAGLRRRYRSRRRNALSPLSGCGCNSSGNCPGVDEEAERGGRGFVVTSDRRNGRQEPSWRNRPHQRLGEHVRHRQSHWMSLGDAVESKDWASARNDKT